MPSERAESELRRQQIEAATQNFERAVNDIVQALDGASKTMDSCAQIMAEAASHNQTQADATATASEEATTNVSNVAMAAEEIAQSVEQISTQARASADIARQAYRRSQDRSSATVERLAATVGQINNVSNLIRDVAAQTNLLALNATIEAARAGDAGRGFAVVAQEVKTLAAQTEKATGDITQQISSIEVTTSSVVQAMKAIAGTIGQLDENANDISVAVQQQDAVSKEIARSANAAAERTREVSASVVAGFRRRSQNRPGGEAVLNAGGELAAKAPAGCAPRSSASWRRSASLRAGRSQLLRNADIIAAARAVLRREHADAGAVAQLVDLVEQVDDVEAHGQRLVVRRPSEIVRNAGIDHRIGRGVQRIGHEAVGQIAGAQPAAVDHVGAEQRRRHQRYDAPAEPVMRCMSSV